MSDALLAWLPLIVIFALFLFLGARQMKSYAKHVAEVKSINDEIAKLNRLNHELAKEQLVALQEIKSLLEDRKS